MFSSHSLIIIYDSSNSGLVRYKTQEIEKKITAYLENYKIQLNKKMKDLLENTQDIASWFIMIELNKKNIKDCTIFDSYIEK